jgi:hypothetical protein
MLRSVLTMVRNTDEISLPVVVMRAHGTRAGML